MNVTLAVNFFNWYIEREGGGLPVSLQLWSTQDSGQHCKISCPPIQHLRPPSQLGKHKPGNHKTPCRRRRDLKRMEQRQQGGGNQVQGAGYQVQGAGDQVQGAGDQVEGAGDQVEGVGDQVEGVGDQVQGAEDQVQGARDQVQGAGDQVEGVGDQVHRAGDQVQGAGDQVQGAGDQLQGAVQLRQQAGHPAQPNLYNRKILVLSMGVVYVQIITITVWRASHALRPLEREK